MFLDCALHKICRFIIFQQCILGYALRSSQPTFLRKKRLSVFKQSTIPIDAGIYNGGHFGSILTVEDERDRIRSVDNIEQFFALPSLLEGVKPNSNSKFQNRTSKNPR